MAPHRSKNVEILLNEVAICELVEGRDFIPMMVLCRLHWHKSRKSFPTYNDVYFIQPLVVLSSNFCLKACFVAFHPARVSYSRYSRGRRGCASSRSSFFLPFISAMMKHQPSYLMLAQWRQRRVPCAVHKSPTWRVARGVRVCAYARAHVTRTANRARRYLAVVSRHRSLNML